MCRVFARLFIFIPVYAWYGAFMLPDLPLARRDVILDRLSQGQPVSANDLAAEFGVSEDAIRRDLRALAAEGRCRRVYGGALPMSPVARPLAARLEEGGERKRALAIKAATLVRPGQLLFLDSGSANRALVDALPRDAGLTIATNSVDIAAAALRRSDVRLIVIGGAVDLNVGGAVDASAAASVAEMNIEFAFIGACAVSAEGGVSAFDYADAAFKRALKRASRRCAALATADKLGARAPHRVAAVNEFDAFIVDRDADPGALAELAAAGAVLLLA